MQLPFIFQTKAGRGQEAGVQVHEKAGESWMLLESRRILHGDMVRCRE